MELQEIKKVKKIIEKEFATAIQQLELEGFVIEPEVVKEVKASIVRQLEIDPTYFDNIDLASELMEEIRKAKVLAQTQEVSWEEIKNKPKLFTQQDIKNLPFSQLAHKDTDHKDIIKSIERLGIDNLEIIGDMSTQRRDINSLLNREPEPPLRHDELLGITPDDHHKEKHDLESHIESKLRKELERLVGGGYVDDLHKHYRDENENTRVVDIAGITKNDAQLLFLGITSAVPLTLPTIIGSAGLAIKINGTETGFEYYTPTDTDEKVKYDSADPTAGYVADKFVAGTGITLSEGTGADENKLKITNSLDLSGYLKLDQTTPQTTVGQFDLKVARYQIFTYFP